MKVAEYDERLLVCHECGGDFLYSVDDQKRDEREGRDLPSKCHRCRSGQKPQGQRPQQSRQMSGGREGGRIFHGRQRGAHSEEYRSPSFPVESETDTIYRSPGFSEGGDQSRFRDRNQQGGGGRQSSRSSSRQRYQIVCSNCGKNDSIPFRPSPGRPVFCHDCYETQKPSDKR